MLYFILLCTNDFFPFGNLEFGGCVFRGFCHGRCCAFWLQGLRKVHICLTHLFELKLEFVGKKAASIQIIQKVTDTKVKEFRNVLNFTTVLRFWPQTFSGKPFCYFCTLRSQMHRCQHGK